MFPDVGNEKRNISTTIHSSAMIAIGLDHLPRLQTRSFFHSSVVMPSQIGTPYAAYRKMVLMAVTMTTAMPRPTQKAKKVRMKAPTTMAAQRVGRRSDTDGETFFSQPDPGMPSSRLNANSIRPADATDERPQKHMAIAMPPPSTPAKPASRFSFSV